MMQPAAESETVEEEGDHHSTAMPTLNCEDSMLDLGIQAAKKAACGTRSQDYRCAVCMENYETSDAVYVLPCAHYFHLTCGEGWLADHNACPICKVKVTASP